MRDIIIYFGVPLLVFFLGAVVFWVGMWKRRGYERLATNHLIGEFRPEAGGRRYYKVLKIEENGCEVKVEKDGGHKVQSYFFKKRNTEDALYPLLPPLNIPLLSFMQVPMQMVSWVENNPDPIDPYDREPVATAELIASVEDEDFAAFAMAANKEIQRLQEALIGALATKLNKYVVYAGLGVNIFGVGTIIYLILSGIGRGV